MRANVVGTFGHQDTFSMTFVEYFFHKYKKEQRITVLEEFSLKGMSSSLLRV